MTTLLGPLLGLVFWTFVIWLWMYVTRIPAMQQAKIDAGKIKRKDDLDPLPVSVKQVADNYNHLHEQPTLFYAVCLAGVLANAETPLLVGLAWAYVAARVLHSLVQCTFNYVPLRFLVFNIGSLILIGMAVLVAQIVFAGG